jgi:seryl-tRNA synthetase
MLDIKFIRENKDIVKASAEKKHLTPDIDGLIVLDDKRLELLSRVEFLRGEQNKVSASLGGKIDDTLRAQMIEEMRVVKEELKEKEEALRETIKEWQNLMLLIPNIPDPTSPLGESEDDNVEIRTWGDKPNFSFEPKDHMEIMTRLGMLDIERGTKVHGFRGYFLTGEGVRLCFAIWNYALDFWSGRGFNPVIPPINTKREPLLGCAFIPQGEADIYKAQDDSYFVGTSEVPLMGMYMDEILDKSKLPIKMLGFSPCFRLEAGSHTKDI